MAKSEEDIFPIQLENFGHELQRQILVDTIDYRVITPPLEFYRRRLRLNINGKDTYFRLTLQWQFYRSGILRGHPHLRNL